MSTVFISRDVWRQISKVARASRRRADVAVAYFGKGASRLLPLAKGSILVVDASERSVTSGLTCPADLLKLVNRDVAVFSVPNLHAKVFVLGDVAFVGSANVSSSSASRLVEAVVCTTQPSVVSSARRFVRDNCLHQLTPTLLRRLARMYRPPRVPGGKRGKPRREMSSAGPALPRVLLAQLQREAWSEQDQTLHDRGRAVAKRRQEHPRSFELDSFRYTGRCPFKAGDVVIQVSDEGGGSILASPPGNVRYVRTRRDGNRQVSFVYLERPARRRRSVKALARSLGRGAGKRLQRNGTIRETAFAKALLSVWAR